MCSLVVSMCGIAKKRCVGVCEAVLGFNAKGTAMKRRAELLAEPRKAAGHNVFAVTVFQPASGKSAERYDLHVYAAVRTFLSLPLRKAKGRRQAGLLDAGLHLLTAGGEISTGSQQPVDHGSPLTGTLRYFVLQSGEPAAGLGSKNECAVIIRERGLTEIGGAEGELLREPRGTCPSVTFRWKPGADASAMLVESVLGTFGIAAEGGQLVLPRGTFVQDAGKPSASS